MARFARNMQLAKLEFLRRSLFNHPTAAICVLVARSRDNILRYRFRQCGIVITVHAASEDEKLSVGRALPMSSGPATDGVGFAGS